MSTPRLLAVMEAGAPGPAAHALSWALGLAQARGAELVLFSPLPSYQVPLADVPPADSVSPEQFDREAQAAARLLLQGAVRQAEAAGVMSHTVLGPGEDRVRAIIDTAERRRCGLIVAGSDGSNAVLRLITGNVLPGLITASPLPLLVAPGLRPEDLVLKRVLAVVQDGDDGFAAVHAAAALAREHGASLVLVHPLLGDGFPALDGMSIVPVPLDPLNGAMQQRALQRLAAAAGHAPGLAVQTQLLGSGPPGRAVAEAASSLGCDLIVVAHHGHNAVMRILSGSVVPGLVTATSVPVWLVRQGPSAPGASA
jgi:nucleotide-binding universal stress UspA family protein